MKQIICVHVGSKYSDEYVYKLWNACKRNISGDFLFTVLHDTKTYDILDQNFRTIQVSSMPCGSNNMWWYKMQAFKPEVVIDGQNLLLDLDIVIVDNLDKLFSFSESKFVIIQDFNRHWNQNYSRSNSSAVKFTKELAIEIWNKWNQSATEFIRKYRGDQDWFDDELENKVWWPTEWIQSWKWEVYQGGLSKINTKQYRALSTHIPNNCKILVFHGNPNPHEVTDPIVKRFWQ